MDRNKKWIFVENVDFSNRNGLEGALIMVIFDRYFTYWGEN